MGGARGEVAISVCRRVLGRRVVFRIVGGLSLGGMVFLSAGAGRAGFGGEGILPFHPGLDSYECVMKRIRTGLI